MDSDLQDVARALTTGQIDVGLGEASYISRWPDCKPKPSPR